MRRRPLHLSAYSNESRFYTLVKEQTAVVVGWRASIEEPQWRLEIDPTPSLKCEARLPRTGSVVATAQRNAARAINLVPRIVAATPGCKSVLDFPAATGTAAVPQ